MRQSAAAWQPPGAGGVEMPAGPIWDNADAQRKCPNVCGAKGWNGAWRTTVPGTESVCTCGAYAASAAGMVPMGLPTSCRAAGNDVCAGCSISCPPGKLATCTEGEVHQGSGFPPYCWAKSRCECQ